ncbi:MAG TPA: RluA family pseudouridine synthase [Fibrobacteraceae bacterium]|nr:RluA family pseudouridine synthase [Fibrobacteraceae bacterium]
MLTAPPSEMRFQSEVRIQEVGLPLAQALAQRFTYHSLEEWTSRILRGDVWLKGAQTPPEEPVSLGDEIVYFVRDYSEPPVPTDYEILYRDEDFLVAGKPAGIPIHHTGTIFWNTFTSVLRRGTGNPELAPLHRLDRDTSGVMLFAQNHDTAVRYQKSLPYILLRKLYLAVVFGNIPTSRESLPESLQDCVELHDEVWEIQIPLREQSDQQIRARMIPDPSLGKPCHTRVCWLGQGALRDGRPIALAECELLTGRKHQIRAHLAALGLPVVGDPLYAFDGRFYLKRCENPLEESDVAILGAKTQLLHAWKAELCLPGWPESRWFESNLWTQEMQNALKICGL